MNDVTRICTKINKKIYEKNKNKINAEKGLQKHKIKTEKSI